MKILKALLVVSLAVYILAYLRHDDLPDQGEILPSLLTEPQQTDTLEENLTVEVGNAAYLINPQFDYELYGLVVSYHHTQNWWDYYHSKWEDFLNIKDICVIWGKNLETQAYQNIKFTSGSFTCYYRWSSAETGSQFLPRYFSNNHLLSGDRNISEKILSAKTGDQIRLKGYLVNYSRPDGTFRRNTSLTREDTGNNSCEVVYVSDFEILKPANPVWRQLLRITRYSTPLLFLAIILKALFFPSRSFTV